MRPVTLIVLSLIAFVFAVTFPGCTSYEQEQKHWPDTWNRGTIHISADESFRPVIDAQVQVYESNEPNTKIIVHYKPEADCLRDFLVDSIRVVIATRGFTKGEENLIADSLKLVPRKMVVAKDAVAVIVNPLSPDSTFTMAEIRDILTGRFKKKLIAVFDGVKATSTVRFIVDSVLKGDSLAPGTMAARSSEGVIDYVAKNPNAVGFIGVSWIGNKEDSTQWDFLKKVKVARLESTDRPGGFVLPYQENIYLGIYPMVRDLVYTLKENHKGLGEGFTDFLAGDRGQMIFRRSYLVPVQRNFILRQAQLRE
jgi:phosphate transport system substrate-binding protein